jgi:hypothetical protein
MSKTNTLELIQNTAPGKIAELDMVKDKFIKNYNLANGSTQGDLMYHRQLVFFNQQVLKNQSITNADKFSLYACFVTAAVNGYSFDPEDNEVYLIARGGKACLDRQAGAHVRRLIKTRQIQFAEQSKIVYKGDIFEVENGRVVRHIEKFETEEIIAGYIRFVIGDNGNDRYFVYRKSDFDAWRKKSPNPKTIQKNGQNGPYLSESLWDNGVIDGTTPEPGFLRTKIVKHACKEKCWATGSNPAGVETFEGIEIDAEDELKPVDPELIIPIQEGPGAEPKEYQQFEDVPTTSTVDDDAF